MIIDNLTIEETEPIRQLFTNNLLNNHHIKYKKNVQIEAYQACIKSIQRIHDQYNIDLNTFNPIINKQSIWKWEIIDSTTEYIPSFYHGNYYRSNEIVNNDNNYHQLRHSMTIPSTPYKKTNKIYRNHDPINNNEVCLKDQLYDKSTCRHSIPYNNEVKPILPNNRSCNLFTLWQPKIKREHCINLNKDQLTNSHKPLMIEMKNCSSSIHHRSKSLDGYSNNLIRFNQLNHFNKSKVKNEFSSCIDFYQTNDEETKNRCEKIDYISNEVNVKQKNKHISEKSKQKIKNNHSLITLRIKSNTTVSAT
ncbi:unnamed protein product [Schistosoma rodhaini]|nr:unnamed protein product [Schistosoma rodhaini]